VNSEFLPTKHIIGNPQTTFSSYLPTNWVLVAIIMATRSLYVLTRDRRRFGPGTPHKNVLSRIWRHVLVSSRTRTTMLLDWTRVLSQKSSLTVHKRQIHQTNVVALSTNLWEATRRCALGEYVVSLVDRVY